jgi:hypothetical protein
VFANGGVVNLFLLHKLDLFVPAYYLYVTQNCTWRGSNSRTPAGSRTAVVQLRRLYMSTIYIKFLTYFFKSVALSTVQSETCWSETWVMRKPVFTGAWMPKYTISNVQFRKKMYGPEYVRCSVAVCSLNRFYLVLVCSMKFYASSSFVCQLISEPVLSLSTFPFLVITILHPLVYFCMCSSGILALWDNDFISVLNIFHQLSVTTTFGVSSVLILSHFSVCL